jgi:hypothetical protein
LNFNVISGELDIGQSPVIYVIGPLGTPFDAHVLERRYELINQEVLQADLSRQLANTIHQVLSFTMNLILKVIEFVSFLDDFPLYLIALLLLLL